MHADYTLQLNSFRSLIRDLQSNVTYNNTPVLEFLPHINALLERAMSVCRAATNSDIKEGSQPKRSFLQEKKKSSSGI